jgi:DNA helicase TIP49 (TBP-interacting protein)
LGLISVRLHVYDLLLKFRLYPLQILAIRAQVEEIDIDEESLAYLGEIGQQTSLRYAFVFVHRN